jgi:superfamily II DNA or RNA helicase
MGDFFQRAAEHVRLLGHTAPAWRSPQLGALGAILAHWSLDEPDPTVISIPTGSGKTAVAMAAPFLSRQPPRRVLVLAPAQQLRRQLASEFSSYAQLRRIGVLPEAMEGPIVVRMKGLANDWSMFEDADVVVALPNSISPVHYDAAALPPTDLFDVVIVDEAHHAPAATWLAVIDHFSEAKKLLLTATPRRRDGKRIPGSLRYYYPLRRALDEGLYHPITPILLAPSDPPDRNQGDEDIARQAAALLGSKEHHNSTLLVRAGSVARLQELQPVYEAAGVPLSLLHTRLAPSTRERLVDSLRSGEVRAIGVVGMLGEGFDLPSLRLLAYHDKHRSLLPTAQLIGRLARTHVDYPQRSALVALADADVFPELQGVLRELYDEDSEWAEVLPGIIDEEIRRDQLDRDFADRFPSSPTEVDPSRLQPLKRAIVFEVPPDWDPTFLQSIPTDLHEGASFAGGTILYSGADAESGLLVLVVRYANRPTWSSDPALSNLSYELHVVAYRKPPRRDLPGLVLFNLDREGLRAKVFDALRLEAAGAVATGPERIGNYLDSLDRISVSSVGVRSTNAATRGRATYRNFMGGSVDRGLRGVDMARSALGHVMFQVDTGDGTANAGGAVEKSKVWLTRYGQLREYADWVDATATLLWFPQAIVQGPLLPGMDRGQRLNDWPDTRPLAAELYPGLFGLGLELWSDEARLGAIEDLELYVNDDPTGTLDDVGTVRGFSLPIIGVLNDRAVGRRICVWEAAIHVDGRIVPSRDLTVRRGHAVHEAFSDVLQQQPPTIYFLDGTTTVGQIRYDSRAFTAPFDASRLAPIRWGGVDITAETVSTARARGNGEFSVHEHLAEQLRNRPRIGDSRWILLNDGAGEIADYVTIEELSTGEVYLGLWHAKASGGRDPTVRIKDFQVLVAQAIRSRRHFASTSIWGELAERVAGRTRPIAVIVEGSDSEELLRRRLGLDETGDGDSLPWTKTLPMVRGTVALVQPGLSAAMLHQQLESNPIPEGAKSLREMFGLLRDMTQSDGADLTIMVSP